MARIGLERLVQDSHIIRTARFVAAANIVTSVAEERAKRLEAVGRDDPIQHRKGCLTCVDIPAEESMEIAFFAEAKFIG